MGTPVAELTAPVFDYRTIVNDSGTNSYSNRILVATPCLDKLPVKWVQSRYGQITPPNWGMVEMQQYMQTALYVMRYQLFHAQNLIVQAAIDGDFQWLFLLEHDVIMPPDTFIRLNEHIRSEANPVVSGLYFTRNHPSEPVMYRGRGSSYYGDWELGDRVWVDGVPTGCLLIHVGLLRAMWEESEAYLIGNHPVRMVFQQPARMWFDPETLQYNRTVGTTDLEWCTRVMKEGFLGKAGWHDHQAMEFPFLVDTEIFCGHLDIATNIVYPRGKT